MAVRQVQQAPPVVIVLSSSHSIHVGVSTDHKFLCPDGIHDSHQFSRRLFGHR